MDKICTQKTNVLRKHVHKILLIMRLTTIILIISIMQVSATTYAQKISLSERKTSLSKIFIKISEQTDYDFLVAGSMLKDTKPVTVNLKDVELKDALNIIFKDQPVTYRIEDKVVTVTRKEEPAIVDKVIDRFQAIDVHGRVVDETGKALPGVTIRVKNSNQATTTNTNGEFDLKNVDENATLVLSFIGFATKEIAANGNLNIIEMEISNSKLDEVQIQAYGITSRRLSTGNISTVKAADIEKQPVTNPLLALQGRIPGIEINQVTGYSGTAINVQIQGRNSINSGFNPLYVIDGVPYPALMIPNLGGVVGTPARGGDYKGSGNPLSYVNPADIESIDVLKDADATSIYGSRAANGAILITTKKGKAGTTNVNVNLQRGIGSVSRKLQLLTTPQYLEMRREAFKNEGGTPGATDYDLNGTWDMNRQTDWQKELIGGTAKYNNAAFTLSGGNNNTTFFFGGNYHSETTVIPGDYGDKKGSSHLNVTHTSSNNKFKANVSVTYQLDNNKLPAHDLTQNINLQPNAPALYTASGDLNWAPTSTGTSSWANPLAFTKESYNNQTTNLIFNTVLSYKILKSFDLSTSFGYNDLRSNESQIFPLTSIAPENRIYSSPSSQFQNGKSSSWNFEPQLTYKMRIWKGDFNVLGGLTFLQNSSEYYRMGGSGYRNDLEAQNITLAPNKSIFFDRQSYSYNSFFTRLNYNIEDKYILNITGRRDGSSRFGEANRFKNFWSIGGAWVLSNEKWVANRSFVSFAKLKASYGITGNDQIGNYSYLNAYTYSSVPIPYQGVNNLTPSGLENPYLQWELTKKLNIGIDLGFLQDKFLISANIFRNKSSNQLVDYQLPYTTGFVSIKENLPALVQNKGIELSLTTNVIDNNQFKWSTNLNFTKYKNKLLAYPGLSPTEPYYVIGQPLGVRRLYKYAGVDPTSGLYSFYNRSGEITTNPGYDVADKTIFLDPNPNFFIGFQNTITFRQFSLDFTLQYVKQKASGGYYTIGGIPGYAGAAGNQLTTVLNRWQKPGDNAAIQRFSTITTDFTPFLTFINFMSASDAYLEDASYCRLKNLSLNWQIPNGMLSRLSVKSAQVTLSAQNLLTVTNYTGLDPETQSSNTLPPLKVITIGLKLNL